MIKQFAFPYLYNKTNSGKIRYWKINLKVDKNGDGYLWTEYGDEGGKKTINQPKKIIYKIKPTPEKMYQKLYQLAKTKWENKKKLGFQESKKSAQEETIITKTIIPMRTQNFTKASHKITYPAYVQVKYDGYRSLTDLDKNQMISRQGKPLQNVDHILKEIDKLRSYLKKDKETQGIYLDGELFLPTGIHQLKSLLSKKNMKNNVGPKNKIQDIKYYIFDMIDLNQINLTFQKRWQRLKRLFQKVKDLQHVRLAETYHVKSKEEVKKYLKKFLAQGHEGLVVRNRDGLYRLKARSPNVQKLIEVKRGKFKIVGYKEGAGKQVVWEIQCQKSPTSKTFWASPMGTHQYRQQLLKDAKKYIGKDIQVKYFAIDEEGCVTRNPVAVMN